MMYFHTPKSSMQWELMVSHNLLCFLHWKPCRNFLTIEIAFTDVISYLILFIFVLESLQRVIHNVGLSASFFLTTNQNAGEYQNIIWRIKHFMATCNI